MLAAMVSAGRAGARRAPLIVLGALALLLLVAIFGERLQSEDARTRVHAMPASAPGSALEAASDPAEPTATADAEVEPASERSPSGVASEPPQDMELVAEPYGAIEVRVRYGVGTLPSTDPLVVELSGAPFESGDPVDFERFSRVIQRRVGEIREGRCVFDHVRGDVAYLVSCTPLAHPPLRARVDGPKHGATVVVELEIVGVGGLYGRVTTEEGTAIPGVKVSASVQRKSEDAAVKASAITDEAGAYRLIGVPSGEITLIADLPAAFLDPRAGGPLELRYAYGGSRFFQAVGWLAAGDELLVDLVAPSTAMIAGTVRWPDGRPAADAWFHARREASELASESLDLTCRLNADGGFAFRAPRPGRWRSSRSTGNRGAARSAPVFRRPSSSSSSSAAGRSRAASRTERVRRSHPPRSRGTPNRQAASRLQASSCRSRIPRVASSSASRPADACELTR